MRLINVVLDNCTGCRLCEVVCSLRQEQECSTAKSRVRIIREHEVGNHLVQLCIQCARAPCIGSCPVGALYRDKKTGVVIVDENCNGCGECLPACPLGALFLDSEKGVVFKCDLCGGDPECVKMCPRQALVLVEEGLDSPARQAFMKQFPGLLSARLGGS